MNYYTGDGSFLVQLELDYMVDALSRARKSPLCIAKVESGPGGYGRWEFSTRDGRVVGSTQIELRADNIDILRTVVPVRPLKWVDVECSFLMEVADRDS